MKIKVRQVNPLANMPAPEYASEGAACFDLKACLPKPLSIRPGDSMLIPTGLAFEVPEGFAMLIYSRSGHGFKHGLRLANCVGVIDSDYRGEVMVKLHLDHSGSRPSGDSVMVSPGDSVAQALILPLPRIEFELSDDLSDTVRGTGAFGSTDRRA